MSFSDKLFASITEKIIANLETSGSWMRLWQLPSPVSIAGRFYRGINRLILSNDPYKSRVYGTFKQIKEHGGMVRKGEKATTVVFWKVGLSEDVLTHKQKRSFLLKMYYVFNSEQADFDEKGIKNIETLQGMVFEKHNELHDQAESIVKNYANAPHMIFSDQDERAYYSPATDLISVPKIEYFNSSDAYYKTLFHEMCHSTGHPKRLNRFEGMNNRFGDVPYSKEELVAELGASFLAGVANLEMDIRNSAAYIRGWSSALRDNQKWITLAASRAEKAADHILGRTSSEEIPASDEIVVIPEPVCS